MKPLFQYYTFDIKISNNIFFGPILMELCYLFMNESSCLDNAHQKNKIQNGQGKVPA